MTIKELIDTMDREGKFRIYNEAGDLLTSDWFDVQAFAGREVKTFKPADSGYIDVVIKAKEKRHYTLRYIRSEELYWGLEADSEEEAIALFWEDLAGGEIDTCCMETIEDRVVVEEVSEL